MVQLWHVGGVCVCIAAGILHSSGFLGLEEGWSSTELLI